MPNQTLSVEQVLTALAETPAQIAASTAGVRGAVLHTRPSAGEWSANEVLAHLRACADCWGTAMTTMITEDDPTIRAVNPRTWIDRTDYLALRFGPSLRAFAGQRARLLTLLQGLSPAGWGRTATVTGAGRPLRRTVLFYGRWLAGHERPHIKQIERAVRDAREAGDRRPGA